MARVEQVVIGTDEPLHVVVDRAARTIDADVLEQNGDHALLVVAGGSVDVEPTHGELADDAGMPLSEFRYVADVWADGDPRADDYAGQEALARRVYEQLARDTGWRLILAFNDLQREVAARPGLARSA